MIHSLDPDFSRLHCKASRDHTRTVSPWGCQGWSAGVGASWVRALHVSWEVTQVHQTLQKCSVFSWCVEESMTSSSRQSPKFSWKPKSSKEVQHPSSMLLKASKMASSKGPYIIKSMSHSVLSCKNEVWANCGPCLVVSAKIRRKCLLVPFAKVESVWLCPLKAILL